MYKKFQNFCTWYTLNISAQKPLWHLFKLTILSHLLNWKFLYFRNKIKICNDIPNLHKLFFKVYKIKHRLIYFRTFYSVSNVISLFLRNSKKSLIETYFNSHLTIQYRAHYLHLLPHFNSSSSAKINDITFHSFPHTLTRIVCNRSLWFNESVEKKLFHPIDPFLTIMHCNAC